MLERDMATPETTLRGRYVKTRYGWGICIADTKGTPHVGVALDWRLRSRKRVPCAVRRQEILDSSFCAAGHCVQTLFGTGVVLGFRPADGMHQVQLWGPLGRRRNLAYLRREALLRVMPAATGLQVETPFGVGVCRGAPPRGGSCSTAQRSPSVEGQLIVDFPWGRGYLRYRDLQCPVAVTFPLVNSFLQRAAELLRLHSSTLVNLRSALQGIGLEKLQERLTASANEAMGMASKLLDDWEDRDAKSVVSNLQLKAEEVLADPHMKDVLSEGVARLNKLLSKAEGFDGEWIGWSDSEQRCVIKDGTITWHWGQTSELEIWSAEDVSTWFAGSHLRAKLRPDGCLEWSDGDVWVRKPKPAAEEAQQATQDGDHAGQEFGHIPGNGTVDVALVQQSLGDLRRVIGGEGLEGDVEQVLGSLAEIASSNKEVQGIVEDIQQRREFVLGLRSQFMQSKTGQVLKEGHARLQAQLSNLRETAITPQLERVQARSQRFLTRLSTDKKVKSKAAELFTAAQSRLAEQWKDPGGVTRGSLEAWITMVRERVLQQLRLQRSLLCDSLGDLRLEQLDLQKVLLNSWDPVTLEVQLERSLVRALRLSGIESTGTELLARFESTDSMAFGAVLQRTYKGILGALGDLEIEVPAPIRSLLEAQAAGKGQDAAAWQSAIVNSLDDEMVVSGASELVKQGERMLTSFHGMKGGNAMSQIMEHLESEELERELLRQLHDIDPQAMLCNAEEALTSAQARESLVSHLKDACLDFILKILPAIHIEKVTGNDNGCDWEINNISFSDFSFRKENVHVSLGTPSAGEEFLRVHAWDISALFRNLKVAVSQTSFPFLQAEGVAGAKAERMSLAVAFHLVPGDQPTVAMSSRFVVMESLELWVGETNYAVVVNALTYLFADVLREYACQKICKHLDEHMGSLTSALNSIILCSMPLLKKLGLNAAPAAAGTAAGEVGGSDEGDLFPEIVWADPGRLFAVRI